MWLWSGKFKSGMLVIAIPTTMVMRLTYTYVWLRDKNTAGADMLIHPAFYCSSSCWISPSCYAHQRAYWCSQSTTITTAIIISCPLYSSCLSYAAWYTVIPNRLLSSIKNTHQQLKPCYGKINQVEKFTYLTEIVQFSISEMEPNQERIMKLEIASQLTRNQKLVQ